MNWGFIIIFVLIKAFILRKKNNFLSAYVNSIIISRISFIKIFKKNTVQQFRWDENFEPEKPWFCSALSVFSFASNLFLFPLFKSRSVK